MFRMDPGVARQHGDKGNTRLLPHIPHEATVLSGKWTSDRPVFKREGVGGRKHNYGEVLSGGEAGEEVCQVTCTLIVRKFSVF